MHRCLAGLILVFLTALSPAQGGFHPIWTVSTSLSRLDHLKASGLASFFVKPYIELCDPQAGYAPVKRVWPSGGAVLATYSADQSVLAVLDGLGGLQVWDLRNWEMARRWELPTLTRVLAVSADGSAIATAGQDLRVRVWESSTGNLLATSDPIWLPESICFSRNGQRLLVSAYSSGTLLLDASTGALIKTLDNYDQHPHRAEAMEGTDWAFVLYPARLAFWNLVTGESGGHLDFKPEQLVDAVPLSRPGYAACSTSGGVIRVVQVAPLHVVSKNGLPRDTFLADGPEVGEVTGVTREFWQGTFDIGSGLARVPARRVRKTQPATIVALSPDEAQFATVSGTVDVRDTSTGELRLRLDAGYNPELACWNPAGTVLATNGLAGYIGFWDAKEGRLLRKVLLTDYPTGLAFSPDGRTLACCTASYQELLLLDATTGLVARRKRLDFFPVFLRYSKDGQRLFVGGTSLLTLNAQTLQVLDRFDDPEHSMSPCDLSPDGKRLLAQGRGNRLSVYDLTEKALVARTEDAYLGFPRFFDSAQHVLVDDLQAQAYVLSAADLSVERRIPLGRVFPLWPVESKGLWLCGSDTMLAALPAQ